MLASWLLVQRSTPVLALLVVFVVFVVGRWWWVLLNECGHPGGVAVKSGWGVYPGLYRKRAR